MIVLDGKFFQAQLWCCVTWANHFTCLSLFPPLKVVFEGKFRGITEYLCLFTKEGVDEREPWSLLHSLFSLHCSSIFSVHSAPFLLGLTAFGTMMEGKLHGKPPFYKLEN